MTQAYQTASLCYSPYFFRTTMSALLGLDPFKEYVYKKADTRPAPCTSQVQGAGRVSAFLYTYSLSLIFHNACIPQACTQSTVVSRGIVCLIRNRPGQCDINTLISKQIIKYFYSSSKNVQFHLFLHCEIPFCLCINLRTNPA